MAAEILTPASKEEWLELRQKTIGASEAAALVGAHPWLTRADLWAIKSGIIERDKQETPAMRRGRMLENVAVEFLREEHPTWTVTANTTQDDK